jgi:cardiolipin synthase
VRVIVDGWGSFRDSGYIAAVLRKAGCEVKIYNPLWNMFVGRIWRNHRKILLVDDVLAFVGGINIADPYASQGERLGWADLAVEIRGSACRQLVRRIWGGVGRVPVQDVRILMPGLGGGQRLRRTYLKAIGRAQGKVSLAHAYFLPDRRLVRSLTAAARRGVRVVLLLAGRSDVPFARRAAMRLYRRFLKAGVEIFEWSESVMHAKALVVDERRLLVGSFNLDPLSLVNLEVLVDVENPAVSVKAEAWIADHVARSHQIRSEDCGGSALQRWFLDVLGLVVARVAEQVARFLAPPRISR